MLRAIFLLLCFESLPLIRSFGKVVLAPRRSVGLAAFRACREMEAEASPGIAYHYSPLHLSTNRNVRESNVELHDQVQSWAMIVLNSPICNSPLFHHLWKTTSFHVCADGGANRLYDLDPSYIPDVITGDLDSLKSTTRSYYEQVHTTSTATTAVRIVELFDQDRNDLDKALNVCQEEDYTSCVVYGAFGGRFDQEMASFQALYNYQGMQLYLYDHCTMAFLLPTGHNKVYLSLPKAGTDNKELSEGPACGLIPIGGSVDSLTIRGFKWNLTNHPSRFGGLVSTSNIIIEDHVSVECSHPIVFTAEVNVGLSTLGNEM